MKRQIQRDMQTFSLFMVLAALTIGFVLLLKLVLFAPAVDQLREPASVDSTPSAVQTNR